MKLFILASIYLASRMTQKRNKKNLSKCSRDVPQHQLNFVCRLFWSISSIFQRKFTLKCGWQPKI